MQGKRHGCLDGVMPGEAPIRFAVAIDGSGNADDRHAVPHGVEKGAVALRGGDDGPGFGVLAV